MVRIVACFLAVFLLVGATVCAQPSAEPPPLTPILHGFASFVLPGLGQYLNGEYQKAVVHFVIDIGIIVGSWYLARALPWYGWWVTGTAHTVWAAYSAVDAYQVALRLEGLALEVRPTGVALRF